VPEEDYYSYLQEELENFTQVYLFTTFQFAYTVYFNPSEYSGILENYPYLLDKSYAYGFFNQKFNADARKLRDEKVSNTIIKITHDFLNWAGEDTVLLFHCDTSDERQACRHKLFLNWYERGEIDNLEMISLEVDMTTKKYYIGYITKKENPNLTKLQEEFDTLAVKLIEGK
jgi:hypothetical protein